MLENLEPLVTIIICDVQFYCVSSFPTPLYQYTDEIKSLQKHQAAIGWDNFIRERISKNFQTYIARHYKIIRSKRTPDMWARTIISNLLNIHIEDWKNYCETIYGNNNKQTKISQLHQEKICKTSTIKDEANRLTNE